MSSRKKQKTKGASSSTPPATIRSNPPRNVAPTHDPNAAIAVNTDDELAPAAHQRHHNILDEAGALPPPELARQIFDFPEGSYESRQYVVFSQWPVALQGYIPLVEYEDRGCYDGLRAYCERAGMWELMALDEPLLSHASGEFYSTLVINDYTSTSEQDAICFRLGGRPFRFSVDQFGVAMGFYTQGRLTTGT
ncbi:hypothetical protein LINGRAHAP2_LOCUS7668 [Linum grandiflorum]